MADERPQVHGLEWGRDADGDPLPGFFNCPGVRPNGDGCDCGELHVEADHALSTPSLAARLPLADQVRLVLAGLPERVLVKEPLPPRGDDPYKFYQGLCSDLGAALRAERARADMAIAALRGIVEREEGR